jgi:hypothetical protein
MNPWLEQEGLWLDFHTKFLTAINEHLVGQVRPKYIVVIEQQIYIHEIAESRLLGRADLSLAQATASNGGATTALIEAPAEIELAVHDVERVPYLEIRDRFNREIVTVMEMLSPSNKRGDDRLQYLAKRGEILDGPAHLVEIELLRGGRPMPDRNRPDCVYSVLLSRAEDRPKCGFWPIALADGLPEIPVPLRPEDGDARVDLQKILHRVYDMYGYADFIYSGTPSPPLPPDDARWAKQLLGPEILR